MSNSPLTEALDAMSYQASSDWKKKRNQRLAFDNGLCAICHEPATEVHHIFYPGWDSYSEFGREDVANDLVSVCRRHHRALDDKERGLRPAIPNVARR